MFYFISEICGARSSNKNQTTHIHSRIRMSSRFCGGNFPAANNGQQSGFRGNNALQVMELVITLGDYSSSASGERENVPTWFVFDVVVAFDHPTFLEYISTL